MFPPFIIYLIAFASIAGYWTIHHAAFRNIAYCNGRLILLSILNLLFVTLYPVTANIVGSHPLEPLATVCLSLNSMLFCISAWGVWIYAAENRQLLATDANDKRLRGVAKIMILVAISLVIAIPLAYISVYLAYLDWFIGAPIAAWLSRKKR
jgi:uncharacterized membrane protein